MTVNCDGTILTDGDSIWDQLMVDTGWNCNIQDTAVNVRKRTSINSPPHFFPQLLLDLLQIHGCLVAKHGISVSGP